MILCIAMCHIVLFIFQPFQSRFTRPTFKFASVFCSSYFTSDPAFLQSLTLNNLDVFYLAARAVKNVFLVARWEAEVI